MRICIECLRETLNDHQGIPGHPMNLETGDTFIVNTIDGECEAMRHEDEDYIYIRLTNPKED